MLFFAQTTRGWLLIYADDSCCFKHCMRTPTPSNSGKFSSSNTVSRYPVKAKLVYVFILWIKVPRYVCLFWLLIFTYWCRSTKHVSQPSRRRGQTCGVCGGICNAYRNSSMVAVQSVLVESPSTPSLHNRLSYITRVARKESRVLEAWPALKRLTHTMALAMVSSLRSVDVVLQSGRHI